MRNSKNKRMILNAILLAIGLILHYIFPAFGAGITPDITLVMLFCILIINKDDYKSCLIAGIVTGIFTAMTTKFPAGQVPNLIDKFVTVNVAFFLMKTMYVIPAINKLKAKGDQIVILVLTVVGTLVSGITFLSSALLLVGLPGPFMALFMAVVVPAIGINAVVGIVMYNVINTSMKKTNYQLA